VKLEVYRGGGWQTIKTVEAVSSSGNSEFAPIEVQVPVNDVISGFRIADGCACCIDFSEITVYGGPTQPPTPAPQAPPSPTGTVLVAESRAVAPGGAVQVPIMLHNAQNMASLGFELRYDPSVVQVTNVGQGSLLALISNMPQAGRIIFGFAGTQAISGDGSAAIVMFTAVGAQGSTSPLTLSQLEATDASGGSLSLSKVDGQLTIGQPTTGDINGDGKVGVMDALRALRMYVQLEAENLILDMNQDGRVTPEDARRILELAKPK